jgi:hypothetical protein
MKAVFRVIDVWNVPADAATLGTTSLISWCAWPLFPWVIYSDFVGRLALLASRS